LASRALGYLSYSWRFQRVPFYSIKKIAVNPIDPFGRGAKEILASMALTAIIVVCFKRLGIPSTVDPDIVVLTAPAVATAAALLFGELVVSTIAQATRHDRWLRRKVRHASLAGRALGLLGGVWLGVALVAAPL
jgi:hypothetical protein